MIANVTKLRKMPPVMVLSGNINYQRLQRCQQGNTYTAADLLVETLGSLTSKGLNHIHKKGISKETCPSWKF